MAQIWTSLLIRKEIFAHRTEVHICIPLDQDSGKNLVTGWNPVSICCLKFFPRISFFSENGAMPSTQFFMIVCLTGFLVSIFTINGPADFFLQRGVSSASSGDPQNERKLTPSVLSRGPGKGQRGSSWYSRV